MRPMVRWARSALSLVVLLAVVVLVPLTAVNVARLRFGSSAPWSGVPMPTHWDRERIDDALTGPWRTDLVIDLVVRVGLTMAWVAVTITIVNILLEFGRVIGRPSASRPERSLVGIGWSRRLARFVVVGIIVVVPNGSPMLGLGPALVTGMASGPVDGDGAVDAFDDTADDTAGDTAGDMADDTAGAGRRWPTSTGRTHVVGPGESVTSIAMLYARPEAVDALALAIVEANRGAPMGHDSVFSHPALIEPGWRLRIPITTRYRAAIAGEAVVATPGAMTDVAEGEPVAGHPPGVWPRRWSEIGRVGVGVRPIAAALAPPAAPPPDPIEESPPVVAPPVGFEPPPTAVDPRPPSGATTVVSTVPTSTSPTSTSPTSTVMPPTDASTRAGGTTPVPTSTLPATSPGTGSGSGSSGASTVSSAVAVDPDVLIAGGTPSDPATSGSDGASDAGDPGATSTGVRIGLGTGVMLASGALAVLGVRRRRLWRRGSAPVRAPIPLQEVERQLRSLAGDERVIRLDLVLRSLAAVIADRDLAVIAVFLDREGGAEAVLTGEIAAVEPWTPGPTARSWSLDAEVGRDRLVTAAGITPLPAIAVVQIGVDDRGREVYIDLETVGVLEIDAAEIESADGILRAIAATLAVSPFAESASLIGLGLDPENFVGHPHARILDDPRQLAVLRRSDGSSATLPGMAPAFARRARAQGGERWSPTIVLIASRPAATIVDRPDQLGEATVVVGRTGGSGLLIEQSIGDRPGWTLRGPALDRPPIDLVPIGLDRREVRSLSAALEVVADEKPPGPVFLVRLFGASEVVDAEGRPVSFDKSKSTELLVWMVTHRHRSTRSAARTALWEMNVKNSSFTNIVSDARCSLARHHPSPGTHEWIGRSLNEDLILADGIESDAEIIERALAAARRSNPLAAVTRLRPAVALIRGMPFESSGYLWPDGEGITSSLVVLGTTAATELAEHALGLGDLETVIWSTDHGLRILTAHEGLIGLRLRAHAMVSDMRALRHEWMSYLSAIAADPWSDGVPAPKLAALYDELTSGAGSRR